MNKYRNPWHKSLNIPKPEFYENEFKLVHEYRGVKIYKGWDKCFDYVILDCCITQRAGFSKETCIQVIDDILEGLSPVCEEVKKHLKNLGFNPKSYNEI